MKLSVCIITYNHERFLGEALDSALAQKTRFDFEIVVGEDCSTDGTRAVLEDYTRRYPNRIRALYRENNLGIARNLAATLEACRGQYIALLEGDDSWTHPDKLQRQVDFLDRNPRYSLSFHDVWNIRDDGSQPKLQRAPVGSRTSFSTEDLVNLGNFIPTCSAVFRRPPSWSFSERFLSLRIADLPLHVMTSEYGDLHYMRETMGNYRLHAGGTFSAVQAEKRLAEVLRMYDVLNEYLGYRYDRVIRSQQDHWRAAECFRIGDRRAGRTYAARSLRGPLSRRSLVAALMLASPTLYALVKRRD
jgi:glycosyltransferase involved in cell wall biosynthesis